MVRDFENAVAQGDPTALRCIDDRLRDSHARRPAGDHAGHFSAVDKRRSLRRPEGASHRRELQPHRFVGKLKAGLADRLQRHVQRDQNTLDDAAFDPLQRPSARAARDERRPQALGGRDRHLTRGNTEREHGLGAQRQRARKGTARGRAREIALLNDQALCRCIIEATCGHLVEHQRSLALAARRQEQQSLRDGNGPVAGPLRRRFDERGQDQPVRARLYDDRFDHRRAALRIEPRLDLDRVEPHARFRVAHAADHTWTGRAAKGGAQQLPIVGDLRAQNSRQGILGKKVRVAETGRQHDIAGGEIVRDDVDRARAAGSPRPARPPSRPRRRDRP